MRIVLNGGVRDTASVNEHLRSVDGVMIGRQAYSDPYWLVELQQKLLSKKNRVVLMLDGDHAGKRAAAKIQPVLNNFTYTLKLSLPDGLDPDDLSDAELMAGVTPFFS